MNKKYRIIGYVKDDETPWFELDSEHPELVADSYDEATQFLEKEGFNYYIIYLVEMS